jgi:hypothetical protein
MKRNLCWNCLKKYAKNLQPELDSPHNPGRCDMCKKECIRIDVENHGGFKDKKYE